VRPTSALVFALVLLIIASVALLTLVSSAVAVFTVLVVATYALVYTLWLKRTTPYFTVLGGAVWAAPILVSWLAAGKPLAAEPLLIFVLAACWTAVHAWSVGIVDAADYCAPGIPFMPVAWGPQVTRSHIVVLVLVIAAVTIVLRQWIIVPFGILLFFVAAAALVVQRPWIDRVLARSSIVFIGGYICMLVFYASFSWRLYCTP